MATLKNCNWKVYGPGGAAEILKMNVSTLNSRMKKLGIEKERPGKG
jgi:two-component system response regulator HydG